MKYKLLLYLTHLLPRETVFCNLAFFLPFLRDRRNARFSFRSFKSGNYIRFLKPEKVFTLSHDGPFRLIFRKFGCEGLDFQVFTAIRAIMLLPSWFSTVLLCEGLFFLPFTSVHRPCEHSEKQAFTPKNFENQWEINYMWRRECFFREIKCVYMRAQEGENPYHGHGWGDCPHKSPSSFS